jgi:hypothetical protein
MLLTHRICLPVQAGIYCCRIRTKVLTGPAKALPLSPKTPTFAFHFYITGAFANLAHKYLLKLWKS